MKVHRLLVALCVSALANSARADTFGTGLNTFAIDFVAIGNPGNGDDAGAGGGTSSSPYGGVGYVYRMGKTEVASNWFTKATNAGMANVRASEWGYPLDPANGVSWFTAAAFVNWLNTSTGHHPAYDLTWTGTQWTMKLWDAASAWQGDGLNLFRHKEAFYFLPSEDEWYKAAYHKNDGTTANYWDFATRSNQAPYSLSLPSTASFPSAVYGNLGVTTILDVNQVGSLSPYGTMGQNGNVWEWSESAADGSNDAASEARAYRGGDYSTFADSLRSSTRLSYPPSTGNLLLGFRVASIPEPSSALLLAVAGGTLLIRRRG